MRAERSSSSCLQITQTSGEAELAMVENTVAKQKIIDAFPTDVSPASVSFETIPQAFLRHIRSVESLKLIVR